jgi:pimeloyl-ACP methyl ester carboxylesterase
VTVRCQIRGDGPPLVSLHGASGAVWTPGLERLAERFTVYLPEHPGFGRSERPDGIESVLDLALVYLDLFDALGLRDLDLVGHSLGGWIAAELASLCAHQLRRLVLVSAVGLTIPGEERADVFLLSGEERTRISFADPALVEQALARRPTPEAQREQATNWNMTARLAWKPFMASPALAGRLGRIRVPTLLVWGAQDRIVPPVHAHAYARAIPGAEVALIEACGHAAAVEQPEELARVITTFLARDAA